MRKLIKVDSSDFKNYLNRTEATFQAEREITQDKLKQGIDGLEWLVMQILVDDLKKESLDQWLKLAPKISKGTKDTNILMMNAIRLDHDSFYELHELNWWIVFDETMTYLSLLKERNYYDYLDFINEVYSKNGRDEK
ncbi:hypothetical protein CN692_07730 [Bacillus sp. AFS002410]|uniref:hypothetical protein n=1 Tax=Bacillus sp. AFS002410 TaxID=2033481 RepID=UPI000BEFD84D|nr:hypothetical protein [Bacillus sp. AFS002410]PEJ58167.1 hypothetical protein CN692_07730 [Bacillus sp. AFS002410]